MAFSSFLSFFAHVPSINIIVLFFLSLFLPLLSHLSSYFSSSFYLCRFSYSHSFFLCCVILFIFFFPLFLRIFYNSLTFSLSLSSFLLPITNLIFFPTLILIFFITTFSSLFIYYFFFIMLSIFVVPRCYPFLIFFLLSCYLFLYLSVYHLFVSQTSFSHFILFVFLFFLDLFSL